MKPHKYFIIILLLIAFLVPFIVALVTLHLGNIPFWYDPARDLFLALANTQKPSLIGQTSGIPGIFYGPYWIWFLSSAQQISKDPRVVTFIVLTIPYFVLFPFILYKFRSIFGEVVSVILWLLFILAFLSYSIQLWNPHLAPLFCLVTLYLLITTDYQKKSWKEFYKSLLAGICGGLLMNTHISFGLSVLVGSYLFLFIYKHKFKAILLFSIGFLVTFLPFFAFELRHGFNQIHTVLDTLTRSTKAVRETGSDKLLIINLFFERFATLVHLPPFLANIVFGLGAFYTLFRFVKKKIKINENEKKLLLLVGIISITTLAIYLSSKNPVWNYHFVGVEILFLLLIGFIAKKSNAIRTMLVIWVVVLMIIFISGFMKSLSSEPYKVASLATSEYIITTIYDDAGNDSFSVYTFNPAHFTPDFDYLLLWQGEKRKAHNLEPDGKGKYVYLIIPWTTKDLREDFIDNRTPNKKYKTIKTWHIPDESTILKRQRYEKN